MSTNNTLQSCSHRLDRLVKAYNEQEWIKPPLHLSDSVPIHLWERENSGYQAVLSHPHTNNYPRQPGYEARSKHTMSRNGSNHLITELGDVRDPSLSFWTTLEQEIGEAGIPVLFKLKVAKTSARQERVLEEKRKF